MRQRIVFLLKYLRYYFTAHSKHRIHSPFVFELVTTAIEDTTPFYLYAPIEMLRANLRRSKKMIHTVDYGAGSGSLKGKKKKIGAIATHFAKSPRYGQLLFRLVNYFQPHTLLELGTSLGLSTLYQAGPVSRARFVTLEGCPETAAEAKKNFQVLHMEHIEVVTGNFDVTLPEVLKKMPVLDYVFFDGNHRKEPTLRYFRQCLACAHEHSLFIFDDIHWSDEMEEAWAEIKAHPEVRVTVDLFFLGLVFFRTGQAKEHFSVRF